MTSVNKQTPLQKRVTAAVNEFITRGTLPVPTKQVQMAVRQFFMNEFLPKAAAESGHTEPWRAGYAWLREELDEAVKRVLLNGSNGEAMIRRLIQAEFTALRHGKWSKPADFNAYLDRIVREEVQKVVRENLTLTVSGSIDVDTKPSDYQAEF